MATCTATPPSVHGRCATPAALGGAPHDIGQSRDWTTVQSFQPTAEGRLLGHVHLGLRMIEERAGTLGPGRPRPTACKPSPGARRTVRAGRRAAEAAVLVPYNRLEQQPTRRRSPWTRIGSSIAHMLRGRGAARHLRHALCDRGRREPRGHKPEYIHRAHACGFRRWSMPPTTPAPGGSTSCAEDKCAFRKSMVEHAHDEVIGWRRPACGCWHASESRTRCAHDGAWSSRPAALRGRGRRPPCEITPGRGVGAEPEARHRGPRSTGQSWAARPRAGRRPSSGSRTWSGSGTPF